MKNSAGLCVGEWVEVRSKEEILGTLDRQGRMEGMPFMPQMFQYCGQRFKVYRRAHKTCDTATLTGARRLLDGAHLEEIRCDGEAYGGCQAGCLIFWKTAWLKRVDHDPTPEKRAATTDVECPDPERKTAGCTEADVRVGTRADNPSVDEPRYACQATQLTAATTSLPWWRLSQYWEDYTSGNVTLTRMCKGIAFVAYYRLIESGIGLGRLLRWLYDRCKGLYGGVPYPRHTGLIVRGQPTPTGKLNLAPGELVRVKPYKEILATLGADNRNRGLLFDAEMVPYCGGTLRVLARVSQIVDERTGKMIKIKNDCIVLDGAICQGRYGDCRYCPLFCPRSIYGYWREIWLERVIADDDNSGSIARPHGADSDASSCQTTGRH